MKKRAHADIGHRRRQQIVEAAVGIIAERGLQHLSLSEIEKRAGMCRGQLTYYFPAKEEILLAVFDRLIELMHQRVVDKTGVCGGSVEHGWERMRQFLSFLVLQPSDPVFRSLQYTFLSQIGHRADFCRRLAELYETWRGGLARDVEAEQGRRPGVSARTVATLIQAILHGLAVQRDADAESYDRQEMLQLCLDLLGNYLRPADEHAGSLAPQETIAVAPNGTPVRGAALRTSRRSRVNHE